MPRLRRAIGGICPSPPQPQEISPYRAVSVPDSAPSAPQTPLQTTRPHARPPIPPPGPPPAPVETPIQPSFYFPDTVPSDASVQPSLRARHGRANSDSLFVCVCSWCRSEPSQGARFAADHKVNHIIWASSAAARLARVGIPQAVSCGAPARGHGTQARCAEPLRSGSHPRALGCARALSPEPSASRQDYGSGG